MNKYSDRVFFEVELEDESGEKKVFSARPRSYDLLKKLSDSQEKWAKINKDKPSQMNGVNADYDTFAIIFNVHVDVARKYSLNTILSAVKDYGAFQTKNESTQKEKSN